MKQIIVFIINVELNFLSFYVPFHPCILNVREAAGIALSSCYVNLAACSKDVHILYNKCNMSPRPNTSLIFFN
jgi:hypothetical protein